MITDFGVLERYFLSSLQNIDEQVMLYSCRCLQKLLSGKGGTGSYNEGTQELLIKRQGIQILKICSIDEMIDIRVSSLDILAHLCQVRRDVHDILVDIGMLKICCEYVQTYPNELVDGKVLSLSLEILSSIFEEKKTVDDGLVSAEYLQSVLIQVFNFLKYYTDAPQKQLALPPEDIEVMRQSLKKLCKCSALICKKSPQLANMIRQMKLLDQVITSLNEGIRNMTTVHKPTIYNENLVLNILKLLNASVEGQVQNI